MQGSTPKVKDACCPYGLSQPINPNTVYTPAPPQCSQSVDTSAYKVVLSSVSQPFAGTAGAQYANYTFSISPTGSACDATAINQCCDMAVDGVQLTLAASAKIVSTQLNGATLASPSVQLAASNTGFGAYQTMTVSKLGLTGTAAASSVVVMVLLTTGTTKVPNICAAGSPATATVGECIYALLAPASTSPMCCPSASTTALAPGTSAPTNDTTTAPGSCAPTLSAPLQSTTMGFNYYEGPVAATATSTKFVFMVYNNATCAGHAYCGNVCSWQLFVNPNLAPLLSFVAEDGSASANGMQTIDVRTSNASVTFLSAPPAAGALMYTIVVAKAGVTLNQLCNNQALGSAQGAASCAAVIRSAAVLSTVLFSETDVVMPPNGNGSSSPSPPGTTVPASCTSGAPLSGSCVRVVNGTYNSPSSSSATVVDFNVVNYGAAAPGGCTPDEAVMSFQVLVQPMVATQLQASNAIVPTSAVFGR